MIIIVEGIDRVGKTTLCKHLQIQTGYKLFRDDFRYAKRRKLKQYDDQAMNDEKGNTLVNLIEKGIVDNVIIDRFHWSEFVYGSLERGTAGFNTIDIDNRLANVQGAKVAIVLVEPTNIEESSKQHGKDLSMHAKMFDSLFEQTKIKAYKTDYLRMKETIKEIEKECKE